MIEIYHRLLSGKLMLHSTISSVFSETPHNRSNRTPIKRIEEIYKIFRKYAQVNCLNFNDITLKHITQDVVDYVPNNIITSRNWNKFVNYVCEHHQIYIPLVPHNKFSEFNCMCANLRNQFLIRGINLIKSNKLTNLKFKKNTSLKLKRMSLNLTYFLRESDIGDVSSIEDLIKDYSEIFSDIDHITNFIEMRNDSDNYIVSPCAKYSRFNFIKLFYYYFYNDVLIRQCPEISSAIRTKSFLNLNINFGSNTYVKRALKSITIPRVNEIFKLSLTFKTLFQVNFLEILKFLYNTSITLQNFINLKWGEVCFYSENDTEYVLLSCDALNCYCNSELTDMFKFLYKNAPYGVNVDANIFLIRKGDGSLKNITTTTLNQVFTNFEKHLSTHGSVALKNLLETIKLKTIIRHPICDLDDLDI